MNQERASVLRTRATAPKSAAIAGILFSLLLFSSLVLLLNTISGDTEINEIQFVANKHKVQIALNLVPFASIAFLWFVGVIRDRFGDQEDQLFSTVFVGSGLLFLAMLFVSSSVAGGFFLVSGSEASQLITSDYYDISLVVARETLTNYGIRMAGVFMISTSSLFIRTRVIPRWLAWLGLGLAAIMILRIDYINRLGWVFLSFPLWVLLISIYILIDNYRKKKEPQTP
jgi:MFS family permease